MYLFKRVNDIQNYISIQKRQGLTVGFVPTMGALHEGHLSLIKRASKEVDCIVCSIFVNPTQFNDKSDLDKYPRTIAQDIELLDSQKTTVLFLPDVVDIYPSDYINTTTNLNFGQLDKVMEGAFRPGHFEGMAEVVKRLLDIVTPDKLYMGQKDYQQMTIVESMLEQLDLPIELVGCPIVREEDGLALSSRNVRLAPEIRKGATIIYKTLCEAKEMTETHTPEQIKNFTVTKLTIPDFKPEYVDIVDGRTLQPLQRFDNTSNAVICVAVWAGDVRLIDNMMLTS